MLDVPVDFLETNLLGELLAHLLETRSAVLLEERAVPPRELFTQLVLGNVRLGLL